MREYFIEQVLGKLYAVCYSDGTYTHRAYEGTLDECELFISKR